MTTNTPTTASDDEATVAVAEPLTIEPVATPEPSTIEPTATAEPLTSEPTATAEPTAKEPAAAPAPPKIKPVTWETERNAAVAALMRVGATPRETRVLASSVAKAAAALRPAPRNRVGDPSTADDQAAQSVLDAHRAAASPDWSIQ